MTEPARRASSRRSLRRSIQLDHLPDAVRSKILLDFISHEALHPGGGSSVKDLFHLGSTSKQWGQWVYRDTPGLWKRFGYNWDKMTTAMTDRQLAALLRRVNGKEVVEDISLAMCTQISGPGLEPLRGSTVLRSANLCFRGRGGTRNDDDEKKMIDIDLKAIVSIEKARGVLFGQFGFDDSMRGCQGTTALFWGPRGSGKQDAAEAIGFELGKPLKVTDLPQLLGKSGKANASTVKECFKEARLMDAVLVLGGISLNASEGQRGSSSVEDIRLLNLVVREMTRFPGICIMQIDVVDSLDIFVSRLEKGLLDGLKYLVPFHYPDMYCRKKLWKKRLPDTLPKKSLDYSELARLSDELNTTQIGNAVYRSAAQAALKDENSRFVTMADLRSAIEKERQRGVSAVDRYVRAQYI